MAAWGTGNFANDTACDWAADFVEVGDLSFVREVLEKVAATTAEEYLQARVSCHALAACEVIARLKGHWGTRNSYSQEADDWVQANRLKAQGRALSLRPALRVDQSEDGNLAFLNKRPKRTPTQGLPERLTGRHLLSKLQC
jgi:hypothetical protein